MTSQELRAKIFILKVNGKRIMKNRFDEIINYLNNRHLIDLSLEKYNRKIETDTTIEYKIIYTRVYKDLLERKDIELL